MQLSGSRALVTGAGVRVGRAIALALAEAGCDVGVHYHRSADRAVETAAAIGDLGRRAACLDADLSDAGQAKALVDRAAEALGGLDILVNSAALFLPGDLAATDEETWEAQFALNLRAPFLLSRAFAALPHRGAAAILNVTDARVRRTTRGHLAYQLTKGALEHLTRLLALELAPAIRVNAVAPGALLPPEGEGAASFDRRVVSGVPLRRAGGASAAGEASLFLLRNDFATGVTLPIDGGEYL